MTVTLVRPVAVQAPPITPLPGTLLSAITIVEGLTWLEPAAMFESFNCMSMNATAFPCPTAGDPKVFDGATWIDGFRFAVQGGIQCRSVGFDPMSEAQARQAFLNRESYGVEQAFMLHLSSLTPDVTTLAPTGTVTAVEGLAALECAAAVAYAGVPTIHMSRAVGTLLGATAELVREGDKFFTKQGSKVASGGGYCDPSLGPDGSTAAAGRSWMYATGEIVLARSELGVNNQLNRSTNDIMVLVERLYVAAVDCFAAAVLVEVQSDNE